MDRALKIDTLPTAPARNAQILEPGSSATGFLTEEVENNEARVQSSRTPPGIVVHRLPAEIWMAICDALRQLDLIDYTNRRALEQGVLPELQRMTLPDMSPPPQSHFAFPAGDYST
ncbi:hypothetical protein FRC00_012798 [Tulasnella sp. 408]|nr:hypothetical protein FRC00_012798 [Tulasnella sp. 408]